MTVAEYIKELQKQNPNDVVIVSHYEHGGAMHEAGTPVQIFGNYVAIWPDDEKPI